MKVSNKMVGSSQQKAQSRHTQGTSQKLPPMKQQKITHSSILSDEEVPENSPKTIKRKASVRHDTQKPGAKATDKTASAAKGSSSTAASPQPFKFQKDAAPKHNRNKVPVAIPNAQPSTSSATTSVGQPTTPLLTKTPVPKVESPTSTINDSPIKAHSAHPKPVQNESVGGFPQLSSTAKLSSTTVIMGDLPANFSLKARRAKQAKEAEEAATKATPSSSAFWAAECAAMFNTLSNASTYVKAGLGSIHDTILQSGQDENIDDSEAKLLEAIQRCTKMQSALNELFHQFSEGVKKRLDETVYIPAKQAEAFKATICNHNPDIGKLGATDQQMTKPVVEKPRVNIFGSVDVGDKKLRNSGKSASEESNEAMKRLRSIAKDGA